MGLIMTKSYNQEPKMPTDAEILQKVQDKYAAELNTMKELKKCSAMKRLIKK
jgi:hypothetical protein